MHQLQDVYAASYEESTSYGGTSRTCSKAEQEDLVKQILRESQAAEVRCHQCYCRHAQAFHLKQQWLDLHIGMRHAAADHLLQQHVALT